MASSVKDSFPPGLPQPALRALAAGFTRLDDLRDVIESDLVTLHGIGPNTIRIIREALKADNC
jgi:DNA integrity scanning protein DisA with diadenylate cyclase activity